MRVAKAKGRLLGKQPKLNPTQEALLVELHRAGMYASGELVELFGVARLTAYWALRGRRRPRTSARGRVAEAGGSGRCTRAGCAYVALRVTFSGKWRRSRGT